MNQLILFLFQEKRLKAESDLVAMEEQMKEASEKIKEREEQKIVTTPSVR